MKRFSRIVLLDSGLLAVSWLAPSQMEGGDYYRYPPGDGPYYGQDRRSQGYEGGYYHQRDGDGATGGIPIAALEIAEAVS